MPICPKWITHNSLSLRCHTHGPFAKHLMHMAHKSENTSEVVLWLVELYRISGRRVSLSLTFRLETKRPWYQTPSRKKKAVDFTTVTTNAYWNQLNAEFAEVWANERSELWLVVWHVSQTASWSGLDQWTNESCHGFQTFTLQTTHDMTDFDLLDIF